MVHSELKYKYTDIEGKKDGEKRLGSVPVFACVTILYPKVLLE
jgi:hypothetical protein